MEPDLDRPVEHRRGVGIADADQGEVGACRCQPLRIERRHAELTDIRIDGGEGRRDRRRARTGNI